MTEDLGQLWGEIRAGCADFVVFPAPLENLGGSIRTDWPDEDWAAFLAVVRQLSAQPLYLAAWAYGECSLEGVEEVPVDLPDADVVPDATYRGELAQRLRAFDRHRGSVGFIRLSFTSGPVLHTWETGTGWFGELEELIDEINKLQRASAGGPGRFAFAGADAAYRQLAPKIQAAVERAATVPAVLAARSFPKMRSVLVEVDAELARWAESPRDTPQGSAEFRAFFEAVNRTLRVAEAERGQREQNALEHLDDLVDEVLIDPDYRDARLAQIRQRAVRAFITARLGFACPDVADRVYSRAEQARE